MKIKTGYYRPRTGNVFISYPIFHVHFQLTHSKMVGIGSGGEEEDCLSLSCHSCWFVGLALAAGFFVYKKTGNLGGPFLASVWWFPRIFGVWGRMIWPGPRFLELSVLQILFDRLQVNLVAFPRAPPPPTAASK
jgi:hypothetical protein